MIKFYSYFIKDSTTKCKMKTCFRSFMLYVKYKCRIELSLIRVKFISYRCTQVIDDMTSLQTSNSQDQQSWIDRDTKETLYPTVNLSTKDE